MSRDAPALSASRAVARRQALAKLGLAAGAAYLAPTVMRLDRAMALTCPSGQHLQGGKCVKTSDARLKRDIVPVACLANGIDLYRYRYHWSDEAYVGVLAQEIAAVRPEAVLSGPGGFLRVDYGQLGLRLASLAEWQEQGLAAIAA